jgi:hypothetical protein
MAGGVSSSLLNPTRRLAVCRDLDERLSNIYLGLLVGWEDGEVALPCHTTRIEQGGIATWLHFGCRLNQSPFVAKGIW